MENITEILVGYTLDDVKSILGKEGKISGKAGLRYMILNKLIENEEYRKTSSGHIIVFESGLNELRNFYKRKRLGK